MRSLAGEVITVPKSRYTYAPYPWDMTTGWFIFDPTVSLKRARRLAHEHGFVVNQRGKLLYCRPAGHPNDAPPTYAKPRTVRRHVPGKVGRPTKYPWHYMKVGEIFVFATKSLRSAQQHSYVMSRELGKTFKVQMRGRDVICKRTR
jgi:hypothetical protein